MSVEEHLHTLELSLLDHQVRQDPAALAALLADDFREFGASGDVWNKAQVIDGLMNETFIPRTLSDMQVQRLGDDGALVTYLCHRGHNQALSRRSSVWRRCGETWEMVFHQGTKVG